MSEQLTVADYIVMNLKFNAAWVNLPIIRTRNLPPHIDRR
jgi:hypothetical protein